jgi:cation transporter-like permease
LGSFLVDLFPSQKAATTVVLVSSVIAFALFLFVSGRGSSMSDACMRAAGAFFVAVALAPAARVGYLVYPINLLAWAVAFRRARSSADPDRTETSPEPR